jgi:hypothetical protein
MSLSIKKYEVLFLFAMLFVFSFAQMVNVEAAAISVPLTEQEKILQDNALTFLTDVFELDLARYSITQVTAASAPVPNGVYIEFKFESSEGKLDVSSEFSNGKLIWCKLYPVKVFPIYTTSKQSSDVINTAKGTLDRIQTFSAKEYLLTMRNMLDTVTELKGSEVTIGDFTQDIEVSENIVKMSWEPFANGLSNPQYKLYLEFKNGHLTQYANYLDIYKIGSSEVNISEAQAIQIATDHAKTFSYTQESDTVSNFTILDGIAMARISLDNRGSNTLYPFWSILLPLDEMYPGGVTAFSVGIWGDTGEIAYFTPVGSSGDPNAVPSESPEVTQPAPIPLEQIVAVVSALMAAVAVTGYLLYKRKR